MSPESGDAYKCKKVNSAATFLSYTVFKVDNKNMPRKIERNKFLKF